MVKPLSDTEKRLIRKLRLQGKTHLYISVFIGRSIASVKRHGKGIKPNDPNS